MRISGLVAGGVFCHDMGDVTLQVVTDSVNVRFTVLDADGALLNEFTEVYHPDETGRVVIRGLDEVMAAYVNKSSVEDMFSPDSMFMDVGGYATLRIEVLGEADEMTLAAEQRFYQATCVTEVFPQYYKYFLSRFREREVLPCQLMTCGYICRGQSLVAGVAWKSDDGATNYKSVDVSSSGVAEGRMVLHQFKPSFFASKAGAEVRQLMYVTLELMEGGTRIDYLKMVFDHRRFDSTSFMFKNMFGLLENIVFTGSNKCTDELNGSFAWIGRKYRKLYTDLTSTYTVFSGWIDKDTHEAVQDLVRSEEVHLSEDFRLGRMVTVVDVDIVREIGGEKPTNDAITYRVSDRVQSSFSRTRQLGARVFDDTFDNTFN